MITSIMRVECLMVDEDGFTEFALVLRRLSNIQTFGFVGERMTSQRPFRGESTVTKLAIKLVVIVGGRIATAGLRSRANHYRFFSRIDWT